ncbi:hypothetical protein LguiB_022183 [Lonicera macranthoides]
MDGLVIEISGACKTWGFFQVGLGFRVERGKGPWGITSIMLGSLSLGYLVFTPIETENTLLSTSNVDTLVAEIGGACERWGFFQVLNHGVPLERRLKMETAARKFFGQEREEKMKVRRGGVNPLGYYDTEHTKNVRDWKEVLDLTMEDPTLMWASHEPDDQELTE